jgi:hypothetical protein
LYVTPGKALPATRCAAIKVRFARCPTVRSRHSAETPRAAWLRGAAQFLVCMLGMCRVGVSVAASELQRQG